MAKITVSLLRELEQKVTAGEISYSRMVEILNKQTKLNPGNKFEFYKTKAEDVKWRGERYFKFSWDSNHAMQVCLDENNDTKKGKGHYIGIYRISRVTLFSNWYPRYVEPCTENEYLEAFNKAINILQK